VNGDIVVPVGNGIMFDRSGSDLHILYKETPGSSTYGSPDDVVLRNPNGARLRFQTNGTNDRMTIDSSGNVGINKTTPGVALDVVGSSTTGDSVLRVKSNDVRTNIVLQDTTTTSDILLSCYGNNFYVRTGGSDRFIMDSSGRVRTPNVPAFRARAYYTDSSPSYSGQSTAYFYDVNLNNGGHFRTSGTGAYQRFVAPVSGYYAFHLSWVVYQATSGNYYGFQFRKNNVEIEPHHYYKQSSAGNDDGTSMSTVEYCAANDYVTCVTNFQNSEKLQIGVFTGHLIG